MKHSACAAYSEDARFAAQSLGLLVRHVPGPLRFWVDGEGRLRTFDTQAGAPTVAGLLSSTGVASVIEPSISMRGIHLSHVGKYQFLSSSMELLDGTSTIRTTVVSSYCSRSSTDRSRPWR